MKNVVLTELQEAYCKRGREIAGVFVLPAETAIEFVGACRDRGLEIAGVEGFKIIGAKIQPQEEHSNDYYDQPRCHEDCIAFLSQRRGADIWFEVVVAEAP